MDIFIWLPYFETIKNQNKHKYIYILFFFEKSIVHLILSFIGGH